MTGAVSVGRFAFEPWQVEPGSLVVRVFERRGGRQDARGTLALTADAWRELREILTTPARPVTRGFRPGGALTAPLVEHLGKRR